MHEEYWETRSDCTTKIELFQLWINLPARQKADPAAIRYVGEAWGAPYEEKVQVRALGPWPLAVGWPALTRLRVARVSGGACGLLGALPRPSVPFRALPRPPGGCVFGAAHFCVCAAVLRSSTAAARRRACATCSTTGCSHARSRRVTGGALV